MQNINKVKKGGDRTKPVYKLRWRVCEPLIKEMLRFYALHQDISVDQMSVASYNAWVACNTIVKALPTHEQDLILDFFSVSADDKQSLMKWYENQRRLSPEYVNEIVRKVCRLVAIERGIADE